MPAEHTPSVNTYIKSSDAARLLDMSEVQGVRYINRNNQLVKSDVYLTNGKLDYIKTDYLTGEAVRGQDFIRFNTVDGKIVHLDGAVSGWFLGLGVSTDVINTLRSNIDERLICMQIGLFPLLERSLLAFGHAPPINATPQTNLGAFLAGLHVDGIDSSALGA